MEYATFAAGCFWGVEAAFRKVPGVTEIESGYAGGETDSPTYQQVLTSKTGHAEAVRLTYDPKLLDYKTLLDIFWLIHDPTQGMRQGNDVGTQYRSIIFFHTNDQKKAAEESIAELKRLKKFRGAITTTIEPASKFWTAEEYHQRYLDKNPNGYCHVNLPAVTRFLAERIKNDE